MAVDGTGVRVGAIVIVGLRVGRVVGVKVAEGASVGDAEGVGVCINVGASVPVTEGDTSVPGAVQATSKSKRDKGKRRKGAGEKGERCILTFLIFVKFVEFVARKTSQSYPHPAPSAQPKLVSLACHSCVVSPKPEVSSIPAGG